MGDALVCLAAIGVPVLLGGILWHLARRTWRRELGRSAPSDATAGSTGLRRGLELVGFNALVLAFLVSVALLFAETWYRFITDQSDGLNLTRVSNRWFERHYRLNNLRIRDDVDYQKKTMPGRRRLTFLGDSVTAGHGIANVDDRFANLVRRELGPTWEVQVLAANGLDTGPELEQLQRFAGAGFELDTVVLVYYLNDVVDLLPDFYSAILQLFALRPAQPFLCRASFLCDFVYWHYAASSNPGLRNYHEVLREAYRSENWELQRRRLLELAGFSRSRHAALLVLTMPLFELLGPDYPFRDVHRQLDRLWSDAGVPHRDMLDVFGGRAAADLVVNRWDAHPNERAHRLAAPAIAAFIREHS